MSRNILPTREIGADEGDMDEILQRFGAVETDVSGIKAQMPYLATKSDVSDLRASISDAKSSIVQWTIGTAIAVVGTTIAAAALALAFAKLGH